MLLEDDSDKKIADLDAASDRHRLTLERLEQLEPLVRAELQSLQTEARRQRWREISERYDAEARAFATVFREALSTPPTPDQEWHWAIVEAQGYPPRPGEKTPAQAPVSQIPQADPSTPAN